MQEDIVQTPKSLAEVESLIKALYEPSNSRLVAVIQSKLQLLQKSPDGWQLADALLNSNDDKVRFFGALTFTIKLNSDWNSLDIESALSLLSRLIDWLVRLVKNNEGTIVTQKLCSTLATFFLRPRAPWTRCIRTVICALGTGSAVAEQSLHQYPSSQQILLQLSPNSLAAALWFTSAVAEDGCKADNTNQEHVLIQKRLKQNVEEAAALIGNALRYDGASEIKIRSLGISCFANWIFYALRSKDTEAEDLNHLRALVQPALEYCLPRSDEAIDIFVDMLSSYRSFFQNQHLQAISFLLRSQWGQSQLDDLVAGNALSIQFGRLVLAFAECNVEEMFSTPADPNTVDIMYRVHQLLNSPGHPGDEDDLSIYVIEFWITFATYATDNNDRIPPESDQFARNHLKTAIISFWKKCEIPKADVLSQWDADTKKAFGEFRADVKDLFDTAYSALYLDFLKMSADFILEALNGQHWMKVEIGLFTLSTIADSLTGTVEEDLILAPVFNTSLFGEMRRNSQNVPARLHRTAVDAIGSLSSFFERNTQYLADALNFLFTSLTNETLMHIASRSIFALCSSSRKQLGQEVDTLLYHYTQFRSSSSADSLTKEKVMSAIAAVVQGLSPEEARIGPLNKMLSLVENDVHMSLHMDKEAQIQHAEPGFQCLAGMSKALQAPDDELVEVDADLGATSNGIWMQGAGMEIQGRIIGCLEIGMSVFGDHGDIVESVFSTLRSGFTETSPGPFVLEPGYSISLFERTSLDTPRLEYVLSTVSMLLNTHAGIRTRDIEQEARRILQHVCNVIKVLIQPANDPEVAQSCVDVLTSLLSRYAYVLITFQPLYDVERMFGFAIQCLRGSDILPKRSASSFWKAFVVLSFGNSALQNQYENMIAVVGPPIADALIQNIGGNASRSELDSIAEPLKKLVTKHASVKTWLENALFSSNFPSDKVGPADKRKFLAQVISEVHEDQEQPTTSSRTFGSRVVERLSLVHRLVDTRA